MTTRCSSYGEVAVLLKKTLTDEDSIVEQVGAVEEQGVEEQCVEKQGVDEQGVDEQGVEEQGR